MPYITTTEVETYAGLGTGTISASLVSTAEAFFDSLVGYNLTKVARVEKFKLNDGYTRLMSDKLGQEFYLEAPLDTTQVVKINDVTIASIDYDTDGKTLILRNRQPFPTEFPFQFKVEYTGGYNPIPDDVKSACILITLGLNSSKTSQGMSAFRQDLLSVNYDTSGSLEKVLGDPTNASIVRTIINKYRSTFIV